MTDRSRYSNVSLSHATYEVLKKLSSKLLPGNTTLSLSKTVETLALEKMQNITNQNGEYKNDWQNNWKIPKHAHRFAKCK